MHVVSFSDCSLLDAYYGSLQETQGRAPTSAFYPSSLPRRPVCRTAGRSGGRSSGRDRGLEKRKEGRERRRRRRRTHAHGYVRTSERADKMGRERAELREGGGCGKRRAKASCRRVSGGERIARQLTASLATRARPRIRVQGQNAAEVK